jgi:hypothetical protein
MADKPSGDGTIFKDILSELKEIKKLLGKDK